MRENISEIEAREVKPITKNEIIHTDYNITQSNNLVEAIFDMTLNEYKVFMAIVALVAKDDNTLKWYRFTTKELCLL